VPERAVLRWSNHPSAIGAADQLADRGRGLRVGRSAGPATHDDVVVQAAQIVGWPMGHRPMVRVWSNRH
jgi:hypothetical protein